MNSNYKEFMVTNTNEVSNMLDYLLSHSNVYFLLLDQKILFI